MSAAIFCNKTKGTCSTRHVVDFTAAALPKLLMPRWSFGRLTNPEISLDDSLQHDTEILLCESSRRNTKIFSTIPHNTKLKFYLALPHITKPKHIPHNAKPRRAHSIVNHIQLATVANRFKRGLRGTDVQKSVWCVERGLRSTDVQKSAWRVVRCQT